MKVLHVTWILLCYSGSSDGKGTSDLYGFLEQLPDGETLLVESVLNEESEGDRWNVIPFDIVTIDEIYIIFDNR